MLPEHTALGQLEIFEIYEYYDMPVLFACRNKAGHIFMAVWVDETDKKNIWLYVALSNRRFQQIRSGQIDLHDVFGKPENDVVLKVSVCKTPQDQSKVDAIPVLELDENWIPLSGEYLLDVPKSLPPIVWERLDQRDLIGRSLGSTSQSAKSFTDESGGPHERSILIKNWPKRAPRWSDKSFEPSTDNQEVRL